MYIYYIKNKEFIKKMLNKPLDIVSNLISYTTYAIGFTINVLNFAMLWSICVVIFVVKFINNLLNFKLIDPSDETQEFFENLKPLINSAVYLTTFISGFNAFSSDKAEYPGIISLSFKIITSSLLKAVDIIAEAISLPFSYGYHFFDNLHSAFKGDDFRNYRDYAPSNDYKASDSVAILEKNSELESSLTTLAKESNSYKK